MAGRESRATVKRQWEILKRLKIGRTIGALAIEFNCCERTIRRDLDVLQEVGFPIYNEGESDDERVWGGIWRLVDRRII